MLSFLLKLVGVVVIVLVVAHAYMFFRYDSFDACEAATTKVMRSVANESTVEGMAGTAIEEGADLARQHAQRGRMGCYRVVFLGNGGS
ncbi:hypothetical protein [Roseospira visakhapatnamensis]|uniref:Uncharacterized protein n=1 Tax=Roseospira visakhapatnamensis TaxID=390880 RepID=A0A7W6RDF3_9PROT|nr:hypothetical protein [Roseospira visakhapatnamensis]MBB4266407.1 hypothetical protein [Roseospira visakhapatnamensis]